jgi:hypothetical protein
MARQSGIWALKRSVSISRRSTMVGEKVLDLDEDDPILALDPDQGPGGLVDKELAILLVGAQLDDFDPVHWPVAVIVLQPCIGCRFLAQADYHHIPIFGRPGLQFVLHQLQIQGSQRMVKGHDLDQLVAQRPVKERVGSGALDADVLHGEVAGLVVLDLEVIVVNAVDREGERLGIRDWGLGGQARQLSLRVFPGSDLLADDGLQALGGGLDGALVDVGGDPAPAQLLGYGSGGAGADAAIQDQVTGV